MEIKIRERVGTLIELLKASKEMNEEEAKAIGELKAIALDTLEKFKTKEVLEVSVIPAKYEDVYSLGIFIDSKVNKVFFKSVNTDIDINILNK